MKFVVDLRRAPCHYCVQQQHSRPKGHNNEPHDLYAAEHHEARPQRFPTDSLNYCTLCNNFVCPCCSCSCDRPTADQAAGVAVAFLGTALLPTETFIVEDDCGVIFAVRRPKAGSRADRHTRHWRGLSSTCLASSPASMRTTAKKPWRSDRRNTRRQGSVWQSNALTLTDGYSLPLSSTIADRRGKHGTRSSYTLHR